MMGESVRAARRLHSPIDMVHKEDRVGVGQDRMRGKVRGGKDCVNAVHLQVSTEDMQHKIGCSEGVGGM